MKIRQLEYFCAVAEEKSISAAARKLHVAQPPISRQIALLEDELGAQLFRRGNKGMLLTEAGESLYQQSRQLMEGMRRMADNVRSIGSGVSGIVRIGIIYSTVPYAMRYIKSFHKKYPQVELYIRLGSPQDLIADLNCGSLNALFLRSSSAEPSGLYERVLGEDSLALIMTRETDPAPGLADVPIELLHDVPMCLLRSDDLWSYDEYLLRECQRNGFEPRIVCHCYDTPMAMQLVQSGFGVSFLPRSIVETHPNSGIYAKSVRGVIAKSYSVLAWNDDVYRARSVRLFTEEKLPDAQT